MPNILITSAGRRVSLVKYFQKELQEAFDHSSKVYTTDLNPEMSAACHESDQGFQVGYFSDPSYMEDLKKICIENEIKLIVPTLDTELILLSKHREEFSKLGIEIIVSDLPFIQVCRDKRKMNDFFIKNEFLLPKLVDRHNPSFPVFIKPIDGSSSKDLHLITNENQLSNDLVSREDLIWMEYLSKDDYEEYTVDIYYNKNSQIKCIVPRVRIAVRGGETNKGITKRDDQLIEFIHEKLKVIEGARGCLTLQVFRGRHDNKIFGIEINPRFGGGYPLSYLAGANYPKWLISEYLQGGEIDFYDNWKDNLLLLRYDFEMTIENFDYNF